MHPASRAALRRSLAVYGPPARTPPSRWMEGEYVVSAEESAEPGRYSFDRYAYLREILDPLSTPTSGWWPCPRCQTPDRGGMPGSLDD
jgi:hypothetical protein